MPAFPIKTIFLTSAAAVTAALFFAPAEQAVAAKSDGCAGGGFTISRLADGTTVGDGETNIPAGNLGEVFLVQGRYNEFLVVSRTFGLRDYAFTGAANPEDITGRRPTPVWAEKTPDHRGLVLTSDVNVDIDGPDLVITRTGTGGLTMKIQAKDCAQGGIFQMEPERGDGTTTLFTHVLAPEQFYFDNPNFRAREGDLVPFKDIMIPVRTRISITNNISRKFILRDSAQVSERRDEPDCPNTFFSRRLKANENVAHCGGVSRWDVASGGRMGFVTGEDAIEMAPSPTECTHKCQAQNRVRGRSVKLGFPFPAPRNLTPRFPSDL